MLKIGEKIKELRKAQDVTQEKLADYLNISYQAVSKWENGLALPDITLLPQLASFFGVTVDELLGVTKPEQSEELTQYEKQYFKFGREGKVLEKIALCREVLKKYPRNYQWMLNLAYGLVSYAATKEQEEYSKEHKFTEEAINLCEKVLEDCTTDRLRHSAIQILCYNYPYVGKKAEAIQLAESMPDMLLSREALLSRIYKGEECLKQDQQNLSNMIDWCAGIIYEMACRSDLKQGLSNEQRIHLLNTAIKLYQMIYEKDENSSIYNCSLSHYYLMIARLYCYENKFEEAMRNLLISENHAKVFDNNLNLGEQKFKSIYLNRLTWNPQKIVTNSDKTLCEELLMNLNDNCFDGLKNNEGFIALKERLKSRNKAIKFKISDISELHRFADSNVKILDWQKDFNLINQFYKDGFLIYDLLKNDPDEFESLGTVAYVKDGQIISLADIMKIKENELQIGAIATLPAERNKGYCKAVVSAAAERILLLGYAAKLTTNNNNIAMQKVAKAIGMTADID